MKLALVQMSNSRDIQINLKKSVSAIQEASQNGADIVLFPEVQLTEFFPQFQGKDVKDYGMEIDSAIVQEIQKSCRDNHVMAVPNIYLKENGKYYDASVLIDKSGDIIGIQKMVHVAQAKQFYEQDYYEPSDDGFKVFDTEFGKLGIVVCFDRHYPESIRTETLMGADLILIPTVNTKAEPSEMFEWELRVQAYQNSVFIAMCNRVGVEDAMEFSGESIVVDANGEVLIKADDKEQIVCVEIDLDESKKIRESRPYTNLRRPELYR